MKSVIIHALLAVFGLAFAYQTWARKPEEEAAPGSVEVAECNLDALSRVALETPTLEVQVEPKREGGTTKYWITTRHRSPEEVNKAAADKAKPDAGASDSQVAKPEKQEKPEKKDVPDAQKPKRFLANAAFEAYLKRFAPLRAQRSLGKLDASKDADFGFDKATTKLQVECAGRPLTLEAGARAFGASQRYLRDPKTQTTFLFDEPVISDLESAQFKFMQSELNDFKPDEIEEVTVNAQGATRRLLHRDRKVAEQAQWVDEKAPATRNELYNNWFSRLGRLRARVYLPAGAEPGSDLKTAATGVSPVLTASYKVADKPAAKLELVRVDEGGTGHYYARTDTTRNWVALYDSAAKEVEQDVGMVVGTEQQPAPATKPDASKPAAHGSKPEPTAPHGGLPSGHPAVPGLPSGHPSVPGLQQ